MKKELMLIMLACVWITANYWYEYTHDGIEYALTSDKNGENWRMLRPIEKDLSFLNKWTVRNLKYKAEELGYSTCTTFCASTTCWHFDENGNQVFI